MSSPERIDAKGGCGTPASASASRIASLCVIRYAVSVPIPGSPSVSATAATTGTARSAEHSQDAVHSVPTANLGHRRDVGEVDDGGDIRRREARGLDVPVDRDDVQSPPPCVLDRTALVAPGADEEDRLHGRRC